MVYRKPDVDINAFALPKARAELHTFRHFELAFFGEALNFFAGIDDDLKRIFYHLNTLRNGEEVWLVEASPIAELFVAIRDHAVWILKVRRY